MQIGFLLCLVTNEGSSIYLLQQLAEKGQQVSKEKLQRSLDVVQYPGHDQRSEGIQWSPKELSQFRDFLDSRVSDSFVALSQTMGSQLSPFDFSNSINLLKFQSLNPLLGKTNTSRFLQD